MGITKLESYWEQHTAALSNDKERKERSMGGMPRGLQLATSSNLNCW
ncbi:hypothetical protein H6F96_00910 [Microcoleus sp. FACHB-53]|nr:hypothetical protein [Microcoleus sp. FACHB-53]MBD2126966.1 hypothetical protein [Microcoleus sp. FACHB-1]